MALASPVGNIARRKSANRERHTETTRLTYTYTYTAYIHLERNPNAGSTKFPANGGGGRGSKGGAERRRLVVEALPPINHSSIRRADPFLSLPSPPAPRWINDAGDRKLRLRGIALLKRVSCSLLSSAKRNQPRNVTPATHVHVHECWLS